MGGLHGNVGDPEDKQDLALGPEPQATELQGAVGSPRCLGLTRASRSLYRSHV